MSDYAIAFSLDEEQREDLFYYVRAMDNAYLAREARQAKVK